MYNYCVCIIYVCQVFSSVRSFSSYNHLRNILEFSFFFYSFYKYLSAYYVPGTVLGVGNATVDKPDKN